MPVVRPLFARPAASQGQVRLINDEGPYLIKATRKTPHLLGDLLRQVAVTKYIAQRRLPS
jgi:hypothetical protein